MTDETEAIPHTVERPPAPGTPAVRPMDPDEARVDDPTPHLFSEGLYRALQQGMQQKRLQDESPAPPITVHYPGVETYLVPDPAFVSMPPGDKLARALHQIWDSGELGEDFKDALEALLSPESLLFFAIFIGLQFVPAVDVAVDAAAFAMLLIYVGGLSVDFSDAMTAVARAKNQQQFDRAVRQLSTVLAQIGAGAVTALAGKIAGETLKRIKSRRAKPASRASEGGRAWTAPREPEATPPAAEEPFAGAAKAPDPVSDPVGWQVHVVSRVVRILKAWTDIFPEIPADRVKAAQNVKVEVTDQAGLNARWKQLAGTEPPGHYPAVRFTDGSGRQLITTTTDGIHVNAHEVGHTLQNPALKYWGSKVLEAFNEHFTQKLLEAYGGKVPCDYVTNGSTAVIDRIVRLLGPSGEKLVRAANFGDGKAPLDALWQALDRATQPGVTKRIVDLVNSGRAPEAAAVLDGYLATPRTPAPAPVVPASPPNTGGSATAPHPAPAAAFAAAELRPLFTEAAGPLPAEWAEAQYAAHVFTPWLNVPHADAAAADAWRSQVVAGVRDDLMSLPASQRWPLIVENVYTARLWPFGERALDLALERHDGAATGDAARDAGGQLDGLASLSRELNWFNPEIGRLVAPEIHRCALNLNYAIDGDGPKSVHLGSRYFDTGLAGATPYLEPGIAPAAGRAFDWRRPLVLVPAVALLGAAAFDVCEEMPASRAELGQPSLSVGTVHLWGESASIPISTAPVLNPSSAAAGAHVSTDPSVTHVRLSFAPGVLAKDRSGAALDALAAQLPAELECGQHAAALTVCAHDAALPPGPYWVGYQELKGPVPMHDTHGWYQYGLVINDGNPDHGVPAGQAPQNSYRGGVFVADLQYNATSPSQVPAWKLSTYLIQGPAKQTASNVRVILAGNKLLWVLPQSEVPIPKPAVRFTAYHAPGSDFGLQPPYDWNASIDPPVNGFAAAGTRTIGLDGPNSPSPAWPWWWRALLLATLGVLAAAAGAWWMTRRAPMPGR